MILINFFVYIASFLLIWFGSGLIVSSLDRFSRKLHISRFAISFIILGLLTSLPEFAVGLSAISRNDPEIYVGNLIGGIPVIFLFAIPMLAILGRGIYLKHELDNRTLFITLGVILAPTLYVLNKNISYPGGITLILLYLTLVMFVQRKHGLLDRNNSHLMNIKAYSYKDLVKILIGMGILFVTSNVIVDKTLYFSQFLNVSPFYLSLLLLALGTNLPELSLAVRSILSGKKDIAFGDYMGSAAANTFLFGVFTVLNQEGFTINGSFYIPFFFVVIGLILFYFFSRSKDMLSRGEGVVLFSLYLLFIVLEILFH